MKRRLLNALTCGSLLACVATAGLWVRSYFRADAAGSRDCRRGYFHASSDRGEVLFTHVGEYRGESSMLLGYRATAVDRHEHRTSPIGHYWHGFQFFHRPNKTNSTLVNYSGVALPHWFLAALCLPLPLYHIAPRLLTAQRQRRRALSGLCPRCGYNLTGNVSGACPECGTAKA